MIRLLADENFNGDIVHGLRQRSAELDVVRVQDVGLAAAEDPMILEWAAREGRVLLTHDRRTMTRYAYERIERGDTMPGIVVMNDALPVGRAIEDILLLVEAGPEDEWEDQVRHLPL